LTPTADDDDRLMRIATTFEALRQAYGRLVEFYKDVCVSNPPNDQRFVPYPNKIRISHGTQAAMLTFVDLTC
jgi:hypothetical protein